MPIEIDMDCDFCNNTMSQDDIIVCETCAVKLEDQIEDLSSEIFDLKKEIESLNEYIEKLEASQ